MNARRVFVAAILAVLTIPAVRFFRQGFFSGYQSCGYEGIARDAAKI